MSDKISETSNFTNGSTSVSDWDLEALRLNQNFDQIVGAEAILTSIAVRKPGAQEWFRVHPDPSWRLQTTILQLKEEGESYLVSPSLRTELWDEIMPIVLYTAVSRQAEPFLWPVRLPKVDGRIDKFIETDLTAAKVAESKWVRRYWVPEIKSHKILAAKNLTDDPAWPEAGFQEIIKIAFRDRFIQDINHPVIKNLRGEA